jgi:hypothetical protein
MEIGNVIGGSVSSGSVSGVMVSAGVVCMNEGTDTITLCLVWFLPKKKPSRNARNKPVITISRGKCCFFMGINLLH